MNARVKRGYESTDCYFCQREIQIAVIQENPILQFVERSQPQKHLSD